MSDPRPEFDLDELRGALIDRLESLAENLLGARNKSHSRRSQWRWGAKGSLALETRGPRRGQWFSHEANEGGGPLQLIQHARRCSLADAIEWAADFTGLSARTDAERRRDQARDQERREEQARRRAAEKAEEAADRQRRVGAAQRLWRRRLPVAGTVADRYLVETRRIPRAPEGWPDALGFLTDDTITLTEPGTDGEEVQRSYETAGALVVAATLPDGTVSGVQRIYLTEQAGNLRRPDGRKVKLTLGVLDGAAVRLPGPVNGPLLLAEGPETGLSAWAATGHETWIALGSLAKLMVPAGRRVVICRDDDPRFSPADRALRRTAQEWRDGGIDVTVATPWPTRRYDKTDLSDALRAGGAEAVRARIASALKPAAQASRRVSVRQAREILERETARWGAAALAFDEAQAQAAGDPVPAKAIRTDVGSGKSLYARRRAARMLVEMRSRGDPRTMFMAVPTHALGDEQAIAFESLPEARAAGLRAVVFRGREARDPEAPGHAMCRHLDAVKAAIEVGVQVQKAACRRRGDDGQWIECPFYRACGYQRQLQQPADLWFVAHEMLFTTKPAAMGRFAAGIVDENPAFDGLEGIDKQRLLRLPLDSLDPGAPGDLGPSPEMEELCWELGDGVIRRRSVLARR